MRDHKSLDAWRVAHEVAVLLYRARRDHWQPWTASVFDQMQRAFLSVQLNVAEGHALRSRARFLNHLTIAFGSAVETVECLEFCQECDMLPTLTCEEILSKAVRVRAMLLGLMKRYRPRANE